MFAFHRRPALDDSMLSKSGGKSAAPRQQASSTTQIDALHVAFAVLVGCCDAGGVSELSGSSFMQRLAGFRGLERWRSAGAVLILFELACRAGLVKAAHVRVRGGGVGIAWVDVGSHQFRLELVRYQQGGQNTAPNLQLHPRDFVEHVCPGVSDAANKIMDQYRNEAVVVTNVTPEQISVDALDAHAAGRLLFI